MKQEHNEPRFPIWLIGDSEPKNYSQELLTPLDSRHPVRHNIWTPVLDVIQGTVFPYGRRLRDGELYVRNPVRKLNRADAEATVWTADYLVVGIRELGKLLDANKPPVVLSFGAFSCEIVRRALNVGLGRNYEPRSAAKWSTGDLGAEFRKSVENFSTAQVNHLPLLHVSIARQFLPSHREFCAFTDKRVANYFDYVGKKLGEVLIQHLKNANIWEFPDPALIA